MNNTPAASSEAIALLLAGSVLVLPFLLPGQQLPVPGFHPEWLAASLGIAAALVLLICRGGQARAMPGPAIALIAFALLLAAQAGFIDSPYLQSSLLAIIYVLYAAMMLWLGTQLSTSLGAERTTHVLAAMLLAGALANAAAGIIQYYGRPGWLEDWIAELRGNRAYGNIAHINLYANYLAVGQASLVFLWLRRRVGTVHALIAGGLLACSSALSGSRSALLFLLWFAMLGLLSAARMRTVETRRLAIASCAVALAGLLAQAVVPWISGIAQLGPAAAGTLERLALAGNYPEPRWQAWWLSLQLFASAPLFGVGIGQFADATFASGMHPDLSGYIWTSPHNLPLHLLAETGVAGATLVLGSLLLWWLRTARAYLGAAAARPELWWIIAAVGVEMLHSLVEFPLWYAHFLGLTALLMGLAVPMALGPQRPSRWTRIIATAIGLVLALALGIMLRDYLRLDAVRVSGTTLTLANASQKTHAAQAMRELTHGPFAPIAEGWIVLGAPLDRDNLAAKLEMSERAARFWPGSDMLARRAIFLALAGKRAEARDLLQRTLIAFPQRCTVLMALLNQALAADPEAIAPLLAAVRRQKACAGQAP